MRFACSWALLLYLAVFFTPDIIRPTHQSCGGRIYKGTSGFTTLMSPNYPNYYPNNLWCTWNIHYPKHSKMRISGEGFDIEPHSSCGYDYLEMWTGSRSMGKYCGTVSPGRWLTTDRDQDTLTVLFRTDYSVGRKGFRMNIFNDCGREISGISTAPAYLTSPFYPNSYPHNVDCLYYLRYPYKSIILFKIVDLGIEAHPSCGFDYLRLYSIIRAGTEFPEEKDILKICGSTRPQSLTSSDYGVYVHFRSDYSVTNKGFKLEYKSIACGGVPPAITDPNQRKTHTSEYFPNNYRNNVDCVWIIQVTVTRKLKVDFQFFELEYHSSCLFDYMWLFDGPAPWSPSLGKYCGTNSPGQKTSTGYAMYFRFHTDYSVTRKGFKMVYGIA